MVMDSISSQFNKIWVENEVAPDIFRFLAEHADIQEDELVATIVVDQSHRWTQSEPLEVERYLDGIHPRKLSRQSRVELVLSEFRARGLRPTAENILEYVTRFSDLRKELSKQFGEMARANQTLNELTLYMEDESRPTTQSTLDSEDEVVASKVRYELRKVLGEGAFGKVYLGYDHELERPVAIKFPNDKRLKDKKNREQYLSEARTVASLNHPNIVPVYDIVRREDEAIYIVSKYIEGCTLEDRIRKDLPGFHETCNIVASIANALDHAHQCELVHRDVKPGNILLESATGTAYITDFGLAIKGEHAELQGRISGTPPYMSPEQVRGENHKLDGRSDVFSLGAILYELLTGQRPFDGNTAQDIFREVLELNPQKPRMLNPGIPEELERICLKALSKSTAQRYEQAATMANDLMKWHRTAKFQTLDNDHVGAYPSQQVGIDTFADGRAATMVSRGLLSESKPTAAGMVRNPGSGAKEKMSVAKIVLLTAILGLAVTGLMGILFKGWWSGGKIQTTVEFETNPAETLIVVRTPADEVKYKIAANETKRELDLPSGEYRIEISADGFEKMEERLTIADRSGADRQESSDRLVQRYVLRPQLIPVMFVVEPKNAIVTLNGKEVPFDSEKKVHLLSAGEFFYRFECDPYVPLDFRVVVDRSTRSVEIPPLKIPVTLKADMEGENLTAEFLLDGKKLEPLPGQGSTFALEPGEHEVICESVGFQSMKNRITVSATQRAHSFPLVPTVTLVKFIPRPDGMRIFNQESELKWNRTAAAYYVPPGKYQLRLERPSYLPQNIQLVVGEESLEVELSAWKMEAQFEANTADVSYFLDGKRLEALDAAGNKFAIAEGEHTITAKAKGFEPFGRAIRIAADSRKHSFTLDIKPELSTIPEELYAQGKIVVRVTPPIFAGAELNIGSRKVELNGGLGQLEPSDLDPSKEAWPYMLKMNSGRSIEGMFTRQQLEENGARPTLEISVPMMDQERARKIWILNRSFLKSNPAGVEELLTQAIELDPTQYEILRDRAQCRAELGKYEEAEQDIQVCLKQIPDDYLTCCTGGWTAIGLGRYEVARDRLARAMELRPKSTFALILNALLSYRLKDRQGAKASLEKLLLSTGADDQLAFGKSILAQISADENNFDEAMRLFDEAIAHQTQAGLDANQIVFNRVLGMVREAKRIAVAEEARSLALLREGKRILEQLDIAERDPLFAKTRLTLAEIQFSLGEYQNALDLYTLLIDKMRIDDAKVLEFRARTFEKLGNEAAAARDRQKAKTLREKIN